MRQRAKWSRKIASNVWSFRIGEVETCVSPNLGPVRFPRPIDEDEFKRWVRRALDIKRLPKTFRCWPVRFIN